MENVRVRFAPSPTGYLHVGGARTALFNWLFARHNNGKFFLRIEDTDRTRSTDEAIDAIIDGMKWLGMDWDKWEGSPTDPVRQTDRFEIYKKRVEELLEKGLAYRCYCSAEELEARRKEAMAQHRTPKYDGRCRSLESIPENINPAIRFKAVAEGKTIINDLVKGEVVFDNTILDDVIIMRSDGTPTYNFCVVVDDVDMQITHVIRGDDHLNNTPRQIQLYNAFGFHIPEFGHLSMILGADKSRLSKRHGATAVQAYRDEGYFPEALVNYLVRLGWSHKDQEIFSIAELIEKFSLDQVGKSAAIFNPDKLLWLNAHYLKIKEPSELAGLLPDFVRRFTNISDCSADKDHLINIIKMLQERSRTMRELAESSTYFFTNQIEPDEKASKFLSTDTLSILLRLQKDFKEISFDQESLEMVFNNISKETGLKLSQIAQPLRASITGKTVSPGIYDILLTIGKEKTIVRLESTIKSLA